MSSPLSERHDSLFPARGNQGGRKHNSIWAGCKTSGRIEGMLIVQRPELASPDATNIGSANQMEQSQQCFEVRIACKPSFTMNGKRAKAATESAHDT